MLDLKENGGVFFPKRKDGNLLCRLLVFSEVGHFEVVLLVLVVLGPLLLEDLEPEDSWHVNVWSVLWNQVWVGLQENVWETASEVGSVDVSASLLRHVDVLALRAVALDSGVLEVLAHTDWED